MRLLYFQDDGRLAYKEFGRHTTPQYAILSHTWGDEEVTLQHLFDGTAADLAGYRKILFCGRQAARDGLKYFWIDTCCIDRQNLPELTRAVNSMFRWYRNAARCYVYLSDLSVSGGENGVVGRASWIGPFRRCRWFTRGWTLQELLAPVSVDFFSVEGHLLGDKRDLEDEIAEITGIPMKALRGQPLGSFSAPARFAWAENRETTEEEDAAYCLLGIFDVFMPLMYGEGEGNALKRLERLVDESLNDNLLGGIEETEGHSDADPPSPDTPDEEQAPEDDLADSDAEGKKRRRSYALKALEQAGKFTPLKARRRRRRMPVPGPWHQALCLSKDVAQGVNAGLIFQDAHVSFLNAVYWDEWPRFETFPDRLEMMADLLGHCEKAPDSARLLLACKHIDAFSLRWMHFFTVVEFAMDIDPEWPRTVWGAIRLIFVVSVSLVLEMDGTNKYGTAKQELRKYVREIGSDAGYHETAVTELSGPCPKAP